MSDLASTVQAFTALVEKFRYEQAHDEFYDEQLVKHENEDAPTIGLAQHRQEMKQFLANSWSCFAHLAYEFAIANY